MTSYPFSRAKPLGYASGDILTSAQMNIVDDNASQAADGALWTDIAIAKNWRPKIEPANETYFALFDEPSSRWYVFGVSGGNPVGYYTHEGGNELTASASLQNGDGLSIGCGASNGTGTMVVGGEPGAASTNKLRLSTNSGTSWALQAIGSADTAIVTALFWSSLTSLFLAALDDGTLYSSTDGATWTPRTNPISPSPIVGFASNGTTIVGVTDASTATSISSTNGTTFTTRTLPTTAARVGVTYSSGLGNYYAITAAGHLASSADGVTWATVTTTDFGSEFTDLSSIVSIGRVLVATADSSDVMASVDGEIWKIVLDCPQPVGVFDNGRQLVVLTGAALDVIFSISLGF